MTEDMFEENETKGVKTVKIVTDIKKYQSALAYEESRLEILKEELKNYYDSEKQRAIDSGDDFDRIKVDDVLLQESKNPTYSWNPGFRETLIDLGIAHKVLKKGNQMDKRFDLEKYLAPINPENKWLHVYSRKSEEEKYEETQNIELEKQQWREESNDELVKRYIRYKKKIALKKDQYKIDKKRLMEAMLEEEVYSIGGFTVKDEAASYDFSAMYNQEFVEHMELATNGDVYVDLLNDKNNVIEIKPEELFEVQEITKRFRKKRLQQLTDILGNEFYYIAAKRIEENILDRFPIQSSAVDELIDEGFLDKKTMEQERYIASEEDYKLRFEIITEDTIQKRHDAFMQVEMPRRLERSGYYDSFTED